MDNERWKKLEEIFNHASELPPDVREEYLMSTCRGDSALHAEIAELLENGDSTDHFLDLSAIEVAAPSLADDFFSHPSDSSDPTDSLREDSLTAGETLGEFEIVEKLGEGGMGEVYSARDLKLERVVAIKLLPVAYQVNEQSNLLLDEARAASALDHRNIVAIYSIERAGNRQFIVMERVEGETLKARISRGTMPVGEALALIDEIAAALEVAHAAGIVHGDLKPANILLTREGTPKIVDFGIARRMSESKLARGEHRISSSRAPLFGSASYMSPEQIRGETIDGRSDLFSLGAIAYETLIGSRPFAAESSFDILHKIVNLDPPGISSIRDDVPASLDRLISKMLAKERGERLESASGVRQAISAIKSEKERVKKRLRIAAMTVPTILLLALAVWFVETSRRQGIDTSIAEVERLAASELYLDAYRLIMARGLERSADPRITAILPLVTDTISVNTEPEGASVYLRSFTDVGRNAGARTLIGKTPIADVAIARDDYVVDIELDGYVSIRRSISTKLHRTENAVLGDPKLTRRATLVEQNGTQRMLFDAPAPVKFDLELIPTAQAPDRMVRIDGGEYKLTSYGRPTEQKVRLDDFFIDRYEVTNREFKEFVDAGGYFEDRFWKQGAPRDQFTDRSGLPGPRSWTDSNYPDGEAELPVTGVSYFEAAAYAEFRGKKLPTIFQWEKAARDGRYAHTHLSIMPWGVIDEGGSVDGRANFFGSGPVSVDSFDFGISSYGVYNMAGNVSEWLANPIGDRHVTAGGSWKDTFYLFANFGNFPDNYAAETIGFRCVKDLSEADQGSFGIEPTAGVREYKLPDDAEARTIRRLYLYDRRDLRAESIEVNETDFWRREMIRYVSGAETVTAYLYLPRHVAPPFQTILYVPSGAVSGGLTVTQEIEAHAAPYIKAGRAVFSVVLPGYRERQRVGDVPELDSRSIAFRNFVVSSSVDLQRGVDYLETRSEVDVNALACMGVSVSNAKLTLLAVESRCRAVIIMGGGAVQRLADMTAEANGLNLIGGMRVPKLMISGRYDEAISWDFEGEPLYRLLPQPKSLVLLDHGHIPPLNESVPAITAWLDKTLEPVRR